MGSPEQQIAQTAAESNWWQMLWALLVLPFMSKKFQEMLIEIFWKRTLGRIFGKKEAVEHPLVSRLNTHEADDNRRFLELKDFIRDSETRLISAFEGNTGRLEGQIRDLNQSTARRFETFEKSHQDLLFRYMDRLEKD